MTPNLKLQEAIDRCKESQEKQIVCVMGYNKDIILAEHSRQLNEDLRTLISAAQSIMAGNFETKYYEVLDRLEEAVKLGIKQADEYDRFWEAMGCKSKDITIDEAIAKWKAMESIPKPSGEAKQMTVESMEEIINQSGLYIFANSNFTTEQVDCESKCLATALFEAVYGGGKE